MSALLAAIPACGEPGSSGDLPGKEASPAKSPAATNGPASVAQATATAPTSDPSPVASATATAPAAASSGPESPSRQGAIAPSTSSSTAAASAAPSSSATAVASATASATATAAPALTVQSAALQDNGFSVWMQSAKSYKAGQPAAVEVVLVPKGEFHCNEKYPYKVKLGTPPPGVTYPQEIARDASVSATRTSVRVPFTPASPGDARISGKFSFSVCKADQCVIDSREVAATVKVE